MNKLKTFAIAILAAGATVAATNAGATVSTNTQILDNITIALKFDSQGALSTKDNSLAATSTTFTTSDLIQQLIPLCVDAKPTFSKSMKLVYSIIYSNFLVGTPGTVITNATNVVTSILPGTNIGVAMTTGGTNVLAITNGSGDSLAYIISNNVVYETVNLGFGLQPTVTTNAIGTTVTNNQIISNAVNDTGSGTAVFTFNTNSINPGLGYWTTIVPTNLGGNPGAFSVLITQFSPATNLLFTNASEHTCIYTPKSGTTAASLINVDNWVSESGLNDFDGKKFQVYKESGTDLSGGTFNGTNIASQTSESYDSFYIFTAYPTNGAPAGQTNIIFDGYDGDTGLSGIATTTAKLENLTVGGKADQKAVFQVLANKTVAVSGVGYIGGTLTTNALQTNTFNGITTTNITFAEDQSGFANDLGTNNIFQLNSDNLYITGTKDVVANGTITETFMSALSAADMIIPQQP